MDHAPAYRALVVDDEYDVRVLVARALQSKKIACDLAENGLVAERKLSENEYDVVITDLRMPREHGQRLALHILNSPSPPPVIVMTALADPNIATDLFARGVTDIVLKPLVYPVFAIKIKALLDRRETAERPAQPAPAASVASQIEQMTSSLKEQLAVVEKSFKETIGNLETQQEELEEGLLDSVRVLGNLVGHYKAAKGSHASRVEKMSEWLARNVGVKKEQLRYVRMAALLHDIGKFGMPDAVRRKPPGALSEEEFEAFREYPAIGAALISEIRGAKEVAALVEAHAENFDGSGFPTGKRGAEIPLGARIVRVSDGCDTFLMYCGEEGALGKVLEHLKSEDGRTYDPALVKHAMAHLKESSHMATDEGTALLAAKDLVAGMVLAENVYDEEGRFLAREGAQLTEAMLRHLGKLLGEQQVEVVLSEASRDPSEEEPRAGP